MGAQVGSPQPTSAGGETLAKQRRMVRKAQTRGWFARKLRCTFGLHNPPHDKWFDAMGAVMIGGRCTECDDHWQRELVWIGNEWDFEGAAEVTETEEGTSISVNPEVFVAQVACHVQYLNS